MAHGVWWRGGALLSVIGSAVAAGCIFSNWDYRTGQGVCGDSASGGGGGGGCVERPSPCDGGVCPTCGNGSVEKGEACDDGNTKAGDGCSPTCTVELLDDACPGRPITLTPTPVTLSDSIEKNKDDFKPSCTPGNYKDAVYAVTPTRTGTLVATLSGASDKSLTVRTSCPDEGPATQLACLSGSGSLTQKLWVTAGMTYYVVVENADAADPTYQLSLRLFVCGDGHLDGLEECDGGNGCFGCVLCNSPDEFWGPDHQSCYRLGGRQVDAEAPLPWQKAREACIQWGGDLAALGSAKEYGDVLSNPRNNLIPAFWVGGYARSPGCSFTWVEGDEPWYDGAWDVALGQPRDDSGSDACVIVNRSGNLMQDIPCSFADLYLCERTPAGSCGDGVLQLGEECDDKIARPGSCKQCRVVCQQGEFEDPLTHHCYKAVGGADAQSWDEAEQRCQSQGGYLAVLTSDAERSLLRSQVHDAVWLGGRWDMSRWGWADGERFCYSGWASSEPTGSSGACVALGADGNFRSEACTTKQGYVCERNP